jgi:mRNA-degrading endonuclease toxin of MazEF toxin-antitoxin module
MTNFPRNGDIVLVDLGMVAKVRSCLVLCGNPDSERTVSIVAPLTTEIRGGESEVSFPKPPWLAKPCVVNLSGLGSVERHRIQRRLGPFPPDRLAEAKKVLARMFE